VLTANWSAQGGMRAQELIGKGFLTMLLRILRMLYVVWVTASLTNVLVSFWKTVSELIYFL